MEADLFQLTESEQSRLQTEQVAELVMAGAGLGAAAVKGGPGIASWVKGLFGGKNKNFTKNDFILAERVYDQLSDPRMGQLAGKIDGAKLQNLASNPAATRVLDTRTGHINVIQEIDGKLIRITIPRDKMKIISVGPIRHNQVKNLMGNGNFIQLK